MTKQQDFLQFINAVHCTCMTKRPEAQYHKEYCPLNSPLNPFQASPESEISALECEVTRLDSVIEEPPEALTEPFRKPSFWETIKGIFRAKKNTELV